MMVGGVMVDFMDWHRCMYNVRLDGLLVNHRLNDLVHMMMNVFAGNRGRHRRLLLGRSNDTLVLELCRFLL
jgi:hypothetical protein